MLAVSKERDYSCVLSLPAVHLPLAAFVTPGELLHWCIMCMMVLPLNARVVSLTDHTLWRYKCYLCLQVAGRSLRPLSHVKILAGPDSRTAKPQEADACWPVGEQRRDGRTLDETANGGQTPSGIRRMNVSADNGCVAEEFEEPLEDGCKEPDTIMYRSIKQRVGIQQSVAVRSDIRVT